MPSTASTEETPNSNLTERNLALHNIIEESEESGNGVTSWIEKVIADERTHQYYSQLGLQRLSTLDQDDVDVERAMDHLSQDTCASNSAETHNQTNESLKLFEQQQIGAYRETPLERFLTPDGCSDLSFYAREALSQLGTELGDMEGQDKRKAKAKENMDVVIRNKRRKE
ncbi:hypothetical protein F9C07_1429 [Aspergillus flavus]|uniref:Uncharacterized protein n=1 Tax=Aspergillus flavus (strain ATCC 200026 / FGSC A1120 / IAM 13836 / NRRL 3357 / JCM 12722 / SRRC 167) TaxID=332952 RepID=A0A7U2MRB0_ASPFN|nr:uncharacterized protein G4B84_000811 [Aspergillus flavus NRRL3357]KAF7628889.1 hypothetical protein AFLA_004232 [Aspergillus flavus NRRL3357]QMW25566.1 hypothetical protein G4B84_000811 [Aspergillus flavus NRRL3357]QRD88446.1 hypothetical protein F9C07_1429 [Aspergillus flavus]